MEKGKRTRLIIIISTSLIGLGIIGFLAFKYIAPFGKVVSYQFFQKLPRAKEANRIAEQGESIRLSSQIIRNSLSRFSLKIDPKNIENIKVNFKFRPGQKEIKMGIRSDEKDAFLYQPLYSFILKDLNWQNIYEKGLTLWQRNKDFNSIEQFIQNPPENRKIALYLVSTNKLLSLKPIKEKNQQQITIPSQLRGNHPLLIMVTEKPLIIKIAKQDINNYEGADKLIISLFQGQSFITEKTIGDDGIDDNSRLKSLPQETEIMVEDPKPGIYKLTLNFDSPVSDSLITKIEINQGRVIFDKNIFFLGENPTTIFTNSKRIDVLTTHETSLQTIKLNDKYSLDIEDVGREISFDLEKLAGKLAKNELYKLESPKNDLIINGNGYFSFSKDSFFYPEIIKSVNLEDFTSVFDIYNDIDYVLTSLPPVRQDDGWLVSEINIDPKDISINGDTLYFSLEIPDLDKYGGSLEIDSFEVTIKNKGVFENEESISTTLTSAPNQKDSSKKMGLVEKIGQLEVGIFKKLKDFFAGTFGKIKLPFFSKTASPTPTPTINLKPTSTSTKVTTPIPTSKLTPTPPTKPTTTPTTIKQTSNILVKVLNGGAEKGMAGKFADILKTAGFTNVTPGNADKTDYSNAIVQYRNADKNTVDKIIDLLKNDYKTIDRKEISTSSAEIVVILGKK